MKLAPLSIPYNIFWGRGIQISSSVLFLLFMIFPLFQDGRIFFLGAGLLGVVWLTWAVREVLYHQMFEFGFANRRFEVKEGVLFRREREIPIHRIQNVDFHRGIIQRILGITTVRLESAGGGSTEAVLQSVTHEDALYLEKEIRRRKQEEHVTVENGEEEHAEIFFSMSSEEFFMYCALSLDMRWFLLLLSSFTLLLPGAGMVNIENGMLWLALVPLVLLGFLFSGWLFTTIRRYTEYYDFEVQRQSDTLRYERGLLGKISGSIPLDKVQKLIIEESFLMRLLGFAALRVETAGYAPETTEEQGVEPVVPLARKRRVLSLAREIEDFQDIAVQHPPRRTWGWYTLRWGYLIGGFAGILYTSRWIWPEVGTYLPPLAVIVPGVIGIALTPLIGYLQWKHLGYDLKPDYAVTREGFWRRQTHVVPYYRLQTLEETRSPLQRLWNLGTLWMDTAGAFGVFTGLSRAVDIDEKTSGALWNEIRARFRRDLSQRIEKRSQQHQKPEENQEKTMDTETDSDPDSDTSKKASDLPTRAPDRLPPANGHSEKDASTGP